MSNAQMFNAGEAKGTGQAKTDQFVQSAKDTASTVQDKTSSAANTAQDKTFSAANTAQDQTSQAAQSTMDAATQKKDESAGFMQQTGEQMKNMAQGAVDTVKSTLGVGEQKK